MTRGWYADFETLSTRSTDCTSSENMCLGYPGSLRQLSNSHMGPHTRHLTVSFFAQQCDAQYQRPQDVSRVSLTRPDRQSTQSRRLSTTVGPTDRWDGPQPRPTTPGIPTQLGEITRVLFDRLRPCNWFRWKELSQRFSTVYWSSKNIKVVKSYDHLNSLIFSSFLAGSPWHRVRAWRNPHSSFAPARSQRQ